MILFDSSFAGQKKMMPCLPCLSLRTFFWPSHFTFALSYLLAAVPIYFDPQSIPRKNNSKPRHLLQFSKTHSPTHPPNKKNKTSKNTHTNYLDSHMKSTHPTKTHVSSRDMLMLEIVNSKRCGRRPELDPAVATMARPPPITAPTGPATGGVAFSKGPNP